MLTNDVWPKREKVVKDDKNGEKWFLKQPQLCIVARNNFPSWNFYLGFENIWKSPLLKNSRILISYPYTTVNTCAEIVQALQVSAKNIFWTILLPNCRDIEFFYRPFEAPANVHLQFSQSGRIYCSYLSPTSSTKDFVSPILAIKVVQSVFSQNLIMPLP